MKTIGVIGAGSFGSAVAGLAAMNHQVLLFSRQQDKVDAINSTRQHLGFKFPETLQATSDLEYIAAQCRLILPVVPSNRFIPMLQVLGNYLTPKHIVIHGTKGLSLKEVTEEELIHKSIGRQNIMTMSEAIREYTPVVRVGCLGGPNLAAEIRDGKPTAAVVASHFDEVIEMGKEALNSKKFHIFGSHDLLGVELAGALKNIIAIGSGLLEGKGMGRNLQAMLITRALAEMIYLGKALGSSSQAFLGTAGIGDLIATATSPHSRNYSFGLKLAEGGSYETVSREMPELVEGTRTLRIAFQLSRYYKLHTPIIMTLYAIVFKGYQVEKAIDHIMTYPYNVDVDYF